MTETDFANRLGSFMSVYLPHDRNVSKHTLAAYKVAFIDFIIFMEKQKSVSVNRIMLKHVNRENILDYLRWIEVEKGISLATRNYRLAAVKSFCRFLMYKDIDRMAQWQNIMSIPKAKTEKKALEYLTPEGHCT